MAQLSLAGVFDYLDTQREETVMRAISEMYELGKRGLFSDKFIPFEEIKAQGYKRFKCMLSAIYEVDPEFVESNKMDLEVLISNIKGDFNP